MIFWLIHNVEFLELTLSKLDSFDADQGNYPLEGASIYYDSRYLRFYFTGIDEDSAKKKVLTKNITTVIH